MKWFKFGGIGNSGHITDPKEVEKRAARIKAELAQQKIKDERAKVQRDAGNK